MNVMSAYNLQHNRFLAWAEKHEMPHLADLIEDRFHLEEILEFCLLEQRKDSLALQSIWLVEKWTMYYKDHLKQSADFFVEHLSDIKNEGSLRILGNILINNYKVHGKTAFTPKQSETVIEYGFNWLTNSSTSVAVVANAIEILYLFSETNDWIKPELIDQIQHLLRQGTTPAIHARANKFLKKLTAKKG